MASCIVLGCSTGNNGGKQFTLDGVWTLRQMDYPAGGTKTFEETKETLLRLYEGDSVFHQCWMTRTETGLTISPPSPLSCYSVAGGLLMTSSMATSQSFSECSRNPMTSM